MAIESKITETLNKKTWIIPVLFVFMCLFFIISVVVVEIRQFANLSSTFAFSIGGELFAIMVSIVLVASILPAYKRQSGYVRIFVTLLTIGSAVCCLDTVQMAVDGLSNYAMLNRVICIFVFASETAFTFFFWLYINYVLKAQNKAVDVMSLIVGVLFLVFYLIPFVNFFFPLYFTIDEAGVYHRITETWWICRIYIVL